jgi:hypothetical protein
MEMEKGNPKAKSIFSLTWHAGRGTELGGVIIIKRMETVCQV